MKTIISKILILVTLCSLFTGCSSSESVNNNKMEDNQSRENSVKQSEDDSINGKTKLIVGTTSYALQDVERAAEIFNEESDEYELEVLMFDDITNPI